LDGEVGGGLEGAAVGLSVGFSFFRAEQEELRKQYFSLFLHAVFFLPRILTLSDSAYLSPPNKS
jgi:hypothetical protein